MSSVFHVGGAYVAGHLVIAGLLWVAYRVWRRQPPIKDRRATSPMADPAQEFPGASAVLAPEATASFWQGLGVQRRRVGQGDPPPHVR